MDLYVTNVDYNATQQELHQHFSQAGVVLQVKIPYSGGYGCRYAFVTMENYYSAQKAIRLFNCSKFKGRAIHFMLALC
ncbi:MAG: hypothetical protein EZS28_001358 [Streblomastix strix]|uniref:RRM domain-containing protein n=1 Tax=Streblomastix strix TaxID=222440 RepID=A0A5J4X7A2_9EUKA|nr:MAG: hypothetical protein EZS28_001358 [Streblomastix strix]